ncbi:hypothetical protein FACS189454_06740 [Planctomycetales bacterium]|nr:hypothetical protein FACS189443_0510 [Planctomycetales bacterium]GHT46117.1 hypothetical protein FACS189454_06740 [Planctomycetales bacterium]
MLVVGLILLGTWIVPPVVEQTAYSWNRGIENAKADAARKLLAELSSSEERIPWVAKAVAPSVVGIHTLVVSGNANARERIASDVGSGVIVDTAGYVLTNYHVIAHAQLIHVQFNDGRSVEAKVIGQDRITDLAVLKIEADKLQAALWGDSSEIEVGERVVAIGSPFNLQATVTSGIISATERYNPVPNARGSARMQEFLQTDAAINPGNSGGALANMKGELIGINTMIYSETGGNLGIGFAIPSLLARKVYEEIVRNGEMRHGWLGIYMDPITRFDSENAKTGNSTDKQQGVVVTKFLPNSPAKKGGMEVGDIIVKWGGKEITNPLQLSHLIVLTEPQTTQKVLVLRKGKEVELTITLGTRPVNLQ